MKENLKWMEDRKLNKEQKIIENKWTTGKWTVFFIKNCNFDNQLWKSTS